MKLLPIQTSFAAGEISPLMYGRTDTEGYKSGLKSALNMITDSRGPVRSRAGTSHIGSFPGNDARVFSLPVNDNFFYAGLFLAQRLIIGSIAGHNPKVSHTKNSNFNSGAEFWLTTTDGNASSTATFSRGNVQLHVDSKNNRYVEISQNFIVPAAGDYSALWSFGGNANATISIGTTQGGTDVYSDVKSPGKGTVIFSTIATDLWITMRLDSDNAEEHDIESVYLGVSDEDSSNVEFVTPYAEADLEDLQGIPSPSGSDFYVVHEFYPPYKLEYNNTTDAFNFTIVAFTAPPTEWSGTNQPSAGSFFEGRLWLGGTINEPQTLWGSQSGLPEDFTQGTQDDDGITRTINHFGRIEWMVGFKNLIIGTTSGEHIVTSEGGVITPSDMQITQQSAYGSANIQPVQVGDQIFYVSADKRKLRAIQYEWQADNWLSNDLTFASEHITKPGIKHIIWQQNPGNILWCVLNDGTLAALTYERSNNIYGWAPQKSQGLGIDFAAGPIQGTDYLIGILKYYPDTLYFESQAFPGTRYNLDSHIVRPPEVSNPLLVTGLEHLEGKLCKVLVDFAVHPDRTVVNGEITLQWTGTNVVVGLGFTVRFVSLPLDKGSPTGSGSATMKHWNKIYVRLLDSAMPTINGVRPPDRSPSTPMDEPEPLTSGDVRVTSVGRSRDASITIEQDLPLPLSVLAVFGELKQNVL